MEEEEDYEGFSKNEFLTELNYRCLSDLSFRNRAHICMYRHSDFSIVDQSKLDLFLENFDKITLEQLEGLLK